MFQTKPIISYAIISDPILSDIIWSKSIMSDFIVSHPKSFDLLLSDMIYHIWSHVIKSFPIWNCPILSIINKPHIISSVLICFHLTYLISSYLIWFNFKSSTIIWFPLITSDLIPSHLILSDIIISNLVAFCTL